MIFEERKVSPEVLFSGAAEVGDYVVISSLKFDATKIRFNGKDVEVPAFTTPETKLYCIKKNKKNCELLFDNCLFTMTIGPFKKDKKICFSKKKLDWFKEPTHKIAMFNEYSDWWWLSDEYGDCEGDASSANFCVVYASGGAYYSNASFTSIYVRPRFVIGAKA